MKVEDVIKQVNQIAEERDDPERAHSHEDGLHEEVLKAIAIGNCDDPAALAKEALKTTNIDFSRWCA